MLDSLLVATSGGDQITLDTVDSAVLWENLSKGVTSFVNGVLTPVMNVCANNEICLAFLSVTFAGLGVRILRRTVGAFGRGR